MADEKPTTTGDTPPVPTPEPAPVPVPSEISQAVEDFFITIEDLASKASQAVVTLVKVVVRVKFSKFWLKERDQIRDKITKGLSDGETKLLKIHILIWKRKKSRKSLINFCQILIT